MKNRLRYSEGVIPRARGIWPQDAGSHQCCFPLEDEPGWNLYSGNAPSPTYYHRNDRSLEVRRTIGVNEGFAFINDGQGMVTDVDMQCIIQYEGNTPFFASYVLVKGLDLLNFVGITSYNSKIMLYERHGGTWHNLNVNIPVAGTIGKRLRFTTVGNQASLYIADPGDPIDTGLVGTVAYLAPQQAYMGVFLREHPLIGILYTEWIASGTPVAGMLDMDHDGNPDTIIYQSGSVTVSEDVDSFNIDIDGDHNADFIIPKP